MDNKHILNNCFKDHTDAFRILRKNEISIFKIYHLIKKTIENNNTIFIAGNGGSASDSNHFAAELLGKFKSKKRRSFRCISLNESITNITAIANDFSYSKIYSKLLKGLATKDDLFIGLTTSGKSKNIIDAFKYCNKHQIRTIGLYGNFKPKDIKNEISLYSKSRFTARTQEIHYFLLHLICEFLENDYL